MNQTEIDELRERIDAAISTVCNGMAAMSIPADPRDVDLVLADCAKALAALEEARAERDKANARIQQVHDWYAGRWERLRAFLASGSLMEKGACDIMANGRLMIDAFPASPLALAVARAEGAEAERDALKAKLAKVVVSFDAYLDSEDEDRVAEWTALCEAVKAAKVQP